MLPHPSVKSHIQILLGVNNSQVIYITKLNLPDIYDLKELHSPRFIVTLAETPGLKGLEVPQRLCNSLL